MKDYALIMFDLDRTLAPSKAPLEPETAKLFAELLNMRKTLIAVISGGNFQQFEHQFLGSLPPNENYSHLFLLPTSGTRLLTWQGSWHEEYNEKLTPKEKEKIMNAFAATLKAVGYKVPEKHYGDIIEDRDSQITFSALGQKAPVIEKDAWDKDRAKRERIANDLGKRIPEFDVRVGGSTSVDVTRRGVNKGYGIRKLETFLNLQPDQILFIGDALFYGGNDYPARATGVDCIQVQGPAETRVIIRELLDHFDVSRRIIRSPYLSLSRATV